MSTSGYQDVLRRVQRLSRGEQLELMQHLAALVRRRAEPPAKHSILSLQGLGKRVWEGVDAQRYVAEERASWDG